MKTHPHPCERRRALAGLLLLGGAVAPVRRALAADPHAGHHGHAAHMAAAARAKASQTKAPYQPPDVTMVDQNGRKRPFNRSLDEDGRPVMMNFLFTSCTTVCPVMAQIFVQVQGKLGAEAARLHMVSVSIDPEHDTPARMRAYLAERGAGPQWDFYSGTSEASVAVQRAFDAYRGDKMGHTPLTLLRGPRNKVWTRIDGFVRAEVLVDAYRSLAA